MKKLSYLIVLTVILGLVLTGCFLSNVGQVPTSEQSGVSYLTKTILLPDPGLVGLWHFSHNLKDSSGNENHGKFYGTTEDYVTSIIGMCEALSFNGVGDYVSVDDDLTLNITSELTIEAWIVADDISTYKSIVVKGDAYTEGIINYGLQIQAENAAPGTLRFFVYYSGGYKYVDSTDRVIADSQWHHVAVTVNTFNDEVKFYIDGFLAGTESFIYDLPVSASTLEIGRHRHKTLGESQYFNGKIDEVRIWNVALPKDELGKFYDWTGFFRPIDNPDVLNVAKAGRAIPVKFSLDGDQGLNIFEPGYPKSVEFSCNGELNLDAIIEGTDTAGGSILSYDAIKDEYIYVWKTEKIWANSCRQLVVRLNDGTSYEANFKFK